MSDSYTNFKKQFGQNFITSISHVIDIVELLDLKKEDSILEIGPGDGRFTEAIFDKVNEMDIVEIDRELIPHINEKLNSQNEKKEQKTKFTIFNEDILNYDLSKYKDKKYKVFGALPYNISKQIIKKFLETEYKPELMVFVTQKEVAEDYAAKAPKSTFLYNYTKTFANVEYKITIDKELFDPVPKVDGGVLLFNNFDSQIENDEERKNFTKFLKNGFRNPRKKLLNTLKSIYKEVNWEEIISKAGLQPTVRAAEIGFEEWVELYYLFNKN